jgi:hypothetical protein
VIRAKRRLSVPNHQNGGHRGPALSSKLPRRHDKVAGTVSSHIVARPNFD